MGHPKAWYKYHGRNMEEMPWKKQIWEQIEMVLLNTAQIWNNWKAGQ